MKKSKLIKPDPTLKNNLMAFGYECDKGWWPLIDECIEELEKEVNKGKLKAIVILQVKEKFGGLRVYLSGETEDISRIVRRYEILADHVCEVCGEFWTAKNRVKGGWYKVLCSKCAKENHYT